MITVDAYTRWIDRAETKCVDTAIERDVDE